MSIIPLTWWKWWYDTHPWKKPTNILLEKGQLSAKFLELIKSKMYRMTPKQNWHNANNILTHRRPDGDLLCTISK